jgi:hypothetical protein
MYYRGKGCNCRKHLYIYEDGKRTYRSANTRSSKRAEELAQAERDRRDPVKRRLQEIAEQETAKADEEAAKTAAMRVKNITLASALDRWMATHKDIKDGTYQTYRTFIKKVGAWAERKKILEHFRNTGRLFNSAGRSIFLEETSERKQLQRLLISQPPLHRNFEKGYEAVPNLTPASAQRWKPDAATNGLF